MSPALGGALPGTIALVQNTWARIFSPRFLVNASTPRNDRDDFDGFIGIVAKRVLSVAVAKGFFDPLTNFSLGWFAATANRGKCD